MDCFASSETESNNDAACSFFFHCSRPELFWSLNYSSMALSPSPSYPMEWINMRETTVQNTARETRGTAEKYFLLQQECLSANPILAFPKVILNHLNSHLNHSKSRKTLFKERNQKNGKWSMGTENTTITLFLWPKNRVYVKTKSWVFRRYFTYCFLELLRTIGELMGDKPNQKNEPLFFCSRRV